MGVQVRVLPDDLWFVYSLGIKKLRATMLVYPFTKVGKLSPHLHTTNPAPRLHKTNKQKKKKQKKKKENKLSTS